MRICSPESAPRIDRAGLGGECDGNITELLRGDSSAVQEVAPLHL